MGNTIKPQKEEVIINQNGIGSTNSASTEQLQFHVSAISIVMMMILCLLLLLAAYLAYKCYKKCHHDWINDQILRQNLRRSLFRSRALRASPRADEPRCAGCGARTRLAFMEWKPYKSYAIALLGYSRFGHTIVRLNNVMRNNFLLNEIYAIRF